MGAREVEVPRWLRIVIELALFLAALFFFLSPGMFFFVFGQNAFPPLDGLALHGCDIDGIADGSWHVHTWAVYADGQVPENQIREDVRKRHPNIGFYKLLSVRVGKNADEKSLKDCLTWRRKVDAAIRHKSKEKSK